MWGSAYAVNLSRQLSTYCRYENNDIKNSEDENIRTGQKYKYFKNFIKITKHKTEFNDFFLILVTLFCFNSKFSNNIFF